MKWNCTETKYEVSLPDGASAIIKRDQRAGESSLSTAPGTWSWSVSSEIGYGKIAIGKFGVSSLEDAMGQAEQALQEIAPIVALAPSYAIVEKPTDKINMVFDDGDTCLLCEKYTSGVQCLHAAEEIRMAFRLALRLGKHEVKP